MVEVGFNTWEVEVARHRRSGHLLERAPSVLVGILGSDMGGAASSLFLEVSVVLASASFWSTLTRRGQRPAACGG